MKKTGTRKEVWYKKASETIGGLTKKDLFLKNGKIKSIKASNASRKRIKKRLMERKGKPLSKNNSLSLKGDLKLNNKHVNKYKVNELKETKNKMSLEETEKLIEEAEKLKEGLKEDCIRLSNKASLLVERNERKTRESTRLLKLSNKKIDEMKKISLYIKKLKNQI